MYVSMYVCRYVCKYILILYVLKPSFSMFLFVYVFIFLLFVISRKSRFGIERKLCQPLLPDIGYSGKFSGNNGIKYQLDSDKAQEPLMKLFLTRTMGIMFLMEIFRPPMYWSILLQTTLMSAGCGQHASAQTYQYTTCLLS